MSIDASRRTRCVAAAAFFLVAAASQELAVRFALPDLDPTRHLRFVQSADDVPLGEPNTRYRQIKNTGDFNVIVDFNRDGFRDDKDLRTARPDDIFFVGDSFPFGWGVAQSDRITDRLAALVGRPVYNLCTPTDVLGYGRLLQHAESLGAPVRRVVLALSMETDVLNYELDPGASASTTPENTVVPNPLQELKVYLTANSALYFAATSLVHRLGWVQEAMIRLGVIIPNFSPLESARFDARAVESTVKATAALARHYDTIVVIIPSRGLWYGGDRGQFDRIHTAVVDGLKAANVDLVDLRDTFESTGRPLDFHFANDPHWRPSGHELAAETLGPIIHAKWSDSKSKAETPTSKSGLR